MVESDEYFEALGQADEQFRLAVRYKLELGLRAINLCPKLDDRIHSEPESPYSEHHG